MLRRFLEVHLAPSLGRVRGSIVLAVALLFLSTGLFVASVEMVREVIEVLRVGNVAEATGTILGWFRSAGVTERRSLFIAVNIAALALPIVTWAVIYARDLAFEIVAARVTQVLRDKMFDRILRMPYLKLVTNDPGALVKRVAYDAGRVRSLIVDAGLRRIADICMVAGLFIYLFTMDVALALVTVVVVVAYFGGAFWSAGFAKGALRKMDLTLEAVVSGAQDVFSRTTDIRANGREVSEAAAFGRLAADDAGQNIRGSRVLMVDRSFTGMLSAAGPILVTFIGGLFVLGAGMTLETLLAFTATTSMLYRPVNDLSALPIIYQRAAVAMVNVAEILDAGVEGEGEPAGRSLETSNALRIIVRGLRFAYPGSQRALVIDRLEIASGERIAIVGPSGSGKSTLLRVLFRLLDDYEGVVEVDGEDVRTWSRASLRRSVALMTQEAQLFPRTVRENIAYGAVDPEAVHEHALWEAAANARVDGDIRAMNDSMSTKLLVGAANLSGGQRRRLSLARALVRKPGLLLLDEPLTGVPPQDSREVVAALARKDADCTVLLVTHQHDLLVHMDRVVWMDVDAERDADGMLSTRVRAIGKHADLLADSAYASQYGEAAGAPPADRTAS